MPKIIFFIILLFNTTSSYAYLGPGMGGGIIAATIGVIIAFLLAVFGILWFPLKRFMKKKNKKISEEK